MAGWKDVLHEIEKEAIEAAGGLASHSLTTTVELIKQVLKKVEAELEDD